VGDRNTKFFYAACKIRNYKNQINHLINDAGFPMSNEQEIREPAPKFYKKLFNCNSFLTVFPNLIVKKQLTTESSNRLIRPITAAEVKRAVFSFNPDKAPGADGYNAQFFQRH